MSSKRNGILVLLLSLTFIVSLSVGLTAGTYSGGSGTSGYPYQIATTDDLIELSNTSDDWGAYFEQTADISFDADETQVDWDGDGTTWGTDETDDSKGFSPIGTNPYYGGTAFTGSYDGQDHAIDNLYIDCPSGVSGAYVGLFGVTNGASVRNLTLNGVDVTGGGYAVGGLIGFAVATEVSNCHSSGTVQGSYTAAGLTLSGGTGGLIGHLWDGSVEDSDTEGTVTGIDVVGGLIGFNEGRVENCHSDAAVGDGSTGKFVGGLIGSNGDHQYSYNTHTVEGSYSTGDVRGSSQVGGLIGHNSSASLISCHSSSKVVAGGDMVGGLIGCMYAVEEIDSCYHTDGSVSGGSIVGGFAGLADYTALIIKNSYSNEDVTATGDEVGGFIGSNMRSSINNSYSESTVEGGSYVGGFIGYTKSKYYYEVDSSYSTGDAIGENDVGGFIGHKGTGGAPVLITNSYSTGDAIRKSSATGLNFGGFAGQFFGVIKKSYATGSVIYEESENPTDKGFVGASSGVTYQNNFFDSEASNQNTDAAGTATPKTTDQTQYIGTFTKTATDGLDSAWDFEGDPYDDTATGDVWGINSEVNSGYPFLMWQGYTPHYPPKVTTQPVTAIQGTTATGNWKVTDLGKPDPTHHGVCWNTTGSPTTSNTSTNLGGASSTGTFSSSMSNLSPNTTYYVRAYATNSVGTDYGSQETFTTNDPPTASFSYSPADPSEDPDTVQFTDESTDTDGTIVSWDWSFGDGDTSTNQNPTHFYADDGTYTVKLQVVDDDGGTDTATKEVAVGKNTQEGKDVEVDFDRSSYYCGKLQGIKLTFEEVTATGSTEVTKQSDPQFDQPRGINLLGCFYEITTTASFKGDITFELYYDDTGLTTDQEKNLKLFKLTGEGDYEDITKSVDTGEDTLTGKSDSLAYFSLGYGTGTIPSAKVVNHGPNPVPPEGCIFWFDLSDDTSSATLKIFDVDGVLLVSASLGSIADRYPTTGRWLPQDDQGRLLGTGLYLYIVEIEHTDGTVSYSPAQKMMIQQ